MERPKKLWVYRYKLTYYGAFDEATSKCEYHKHSGLIIAEDTKDAFLKLYDEFSWDTDEDTALDFETFELRDYGEFYSDNMMIPDEEDDYYGI